MFGKLEFFGSATVGERGQIVLPIDLRKKINLEAGDKLIVMGAMGDNIDRIPVLPTKSMVSHTGSGAGGIDLIAAAKAVSKGYIPAAINCDEKADGCRLNIASKPIETKIRYALCCGYTFGSQTAAIIIKNTDGEI